MAAIVFTDAAGTWKLHNGKPYPADRFALWTPESVPTGESKHRQSDGALTMFRFRDDFGVTFELPYIPSGRSNNLLQRSEELDNAYWTKTRSSIGANADTAPDGTATADRIIEDATATNTHNVSRSTLTITANVDVAYSHFVKPATRTWVALKIQDSTNTDTVLKYFNLATGAIGTTFATGTGALVRAYTRPDKFGFYRCVLVANIGNGRTDTSVITFLASGDNGATYSGDGASFVSAFGAQYEMGSDATPYLFTDSAARSGVSMHEIADRLRYHLLNGGTCAVFTNDAVGSSYATCGLKPNTAPQIALDRRTMEFTLQLALLNVAGSPARMLARYGDGV